MSEIQTWLVLGQFKTKTAHDLIWIYFTLIKSMYTKISLTKQTIRLYLKQTFRSIYLLGHGFVKKLIWKLDNLVVADGNACSTVLVAVVGNIVIESVPIVCKALHIGQRLSTYSVDRIYGRDFLAGSGASRNYISSWFIVYICHHMTTAVCFTNMN